MKDVTLPDVCRIHADFYEHLKKGQVETLPGLERREYQAAALESIRTNILAGHPYGQLVLATGGGKTTVALNLIAETPGRVLWLAPSNTALQRAIDEMRDLKIKKTYQVVNGGEISHGAQIVFATNQMLLAGEKYAKMQPENFALVVSDEAHHSMGRKTRGIFDHFHAFQLYMTATPETTVSHLNEYARPFFEYSSEDLIRNNGYPPWVLRRYEVSGEKIYNAKIYGDNYKLEEGEETQLLNMPHRFAISLKILREAVAKGEKVIAFMPSVASSKFFVDEIVGKDELLAGKVIHVDGTMGKKRLKELAEEFRNGTATKLAATCNAVWTESLDIPDVKHIVLCDPCCSVRILMQRIGRGARPAKGKTHLTIHDVVSVFSNTEVISSARLPLTVAGAMDIRKYTPDIALNGPDRGKQLFEDSSASGQKIKFVECTDADAVDVPFNERMIDLSFMADKDLAIQLFRKFGEIFGTPLTNLVNGSEQFFKRSEEIKLNYPNKKNARITFKDAFEAAHIFGSFEAIRKAAQEDLDSLCAQISDRVREVLENIGEADEQREVDDSDDPFDLSRLDAMPCFSKQERKAWKMVFHRITAMREAGETPDTIKIPFSEIACHFASKVPKKETMLATALINRLEAEFDEQDNLIIHAEEARRKWEEEKKDVELQKLQIEVKIDKAGKYRPVDSRYDQFWNNNFRFPEFFDCLVLSSLKGEQYLQILAAEWTMGNRDALVDLCTVIYEQDKARQFVQRKKNGYILIPIGHLEFNVLSTAEGTEKPAASEAGETEKSLSPYSIENQKKILAECESEEEKLIWNYFFDKISRDTGVPNFQVYTILPIGTGRKITSEVLKAVARKAANYNIVMAVEDENLILDHLLTRHKWKLLEPGSGQAMWAESREKAILEAGSTYRYVSKDSTGALFMPSVLAEPLDPFSEKNLQAILAKCRTTEEIEAWELIKKEVLSRSRSINSDEHYVLRIDINETNDANLFAGPLSQISGAGLDRIQMLAQEHGIKVVTSNTEGKYRIRIEFGKNVKPEKERKVGPDGPKKTTSIGPKPEDAFCPERIRTILENIAPGDYSESAVRRFWVNMFNRIEKTPSLGRYCVQWREDGLYVQGGYKMKCDDKEILETIADIANIWGISARFSSRRDQLEIDITATRKIWDQMTDEQAQGLF